MERLKSILSPSRKEALKKLYLELAAPPASREGLALSSASIGMPWCV